MHRYTFLDGWIALLQIYILAMYLLVTLGHEGLLERSRWLLLVITSAETTDCDPRMRADPFS